MQKLPKMSKFPVSIPVELHRALKVKCANEGTLMTETIRKLIERECAPSGKAKPASGLKEIAA